MAEASNEPRVVAPEEAVEYRSRFGGLFSRMDLVHTVATEPERIAEAERRGAVKALRAVLSEIELRDPLLAEVVREYVAENGTPL